MNRHDLWRRVEHDVKLLEDRAPEGYEPFAYAYVAGREDPIDLGHVETRRADDDVWTRFQLAASWPEEKKDGDPLPPDLVLMQVHESTILRVEVGYRPVSGRRPIGFGPGEGGDE